MLAKRTSFVFFPRHPSIIEMRPFINNPIYRDFLDTINSTIHI